MGVELDGDARGGALEYIAARTPGRDTLVAVEARRWTRVFGDEGGSEPALAELGGHREPERGDQAVAATGAPGSVVAAAIARGGQPLQALTRQRLERLFGADLSAIRIHEDDRAAAHEGADAFAFGSNVVFARGKYAPEEPAGLWLLAHELQHTIQQRGTTPVIMHYKPGEQGGDPHEVEADSAGDLAIYSGTPHFRSPAEVRLRQQLEQREQELVTPPPWMRRAPWERDRERREIRHALWQLDSSGWDKTGPSPETVARLAQEHQRRLDRAATRTRLERDCDEALAHAPVTEQQRRERPIYERTREELDRLSADAADSAVEAIAVRHASALRSPMPVTGSPFHDDDSVTLPTEPSAAPVERATTRGDSVVTGVGLDGFRVTSSVDTPGAPDHDVDHHVSLDSNGAGYTYTTHDGDEEASLGGSLNVGEGLLDATVSGGTGDMTVTVGAGETFRCSQPQRQSDGRYRVVWRRERRGSLGGSFEVADDSTVDVSARGSSGSSGVEVFATREGADAFRAGFPRFAETALAGSPRSADPTLAPRSSQVGSLEFWSSAEVGTSRTITTSWVVSGSAKLKLAELLSVSGGVEFTSRDEATMTKSNKTQVHAAYQVTHEAAQTAGVAGTGVSLQHRNTETIVTKLVVAVALQSQAMQQLLDHQVLVGSEPGAHLVSLEREHESGSGETVELGGLFHLGGAESTATTQEATFDAAGHATTRVTQHARQDVTGTDIWSDYSHFHLDAAIAEDGTLAASTDFHTTSGAESAELLAEATGTHGIDPRARSSGHWEVTWQLTDTQMLGFHRRFLAHPDPHDLTIYGDLRAQLAPIPQDATGNAARARVLAPFVASEGQRGLAVLQGVAGVTPEHFVRLYTADGQDANIMGASQTRALEQRIARYRRAIEAHELAGLDTEITRDLDELRPRLAAVSDMTRYTDLPRELRHQLCERYRSMIGQLEGAQNAARVDADEATASTLSAHAVGAYREVAELRSRASAARVVAIAERDEAAEHRQYYGQGSQRIAEVLLDLAVNATTLILWNGACIALADGERALADAETRLDHVRGSADELDILRAYRDATPSLQAARDHFEAAGRDLQRANDMYEALVVGRVPPARVPSAARRSRRSQQTEGAHGTRGVASGSAAGATSSAVRGPVETVASGGAAGAASSADHGHVETATPVAPDREPHRGVFLAAYVAPHIHMTARTDTSAVGDGPRVDRGPVQFPSGLVVRLLDARLLIPDPTILDELGERTLFNVEMCIEAVIPGAAAFEVPSLSGMAITYAIVANRVGETFDAVVCC